MSTLSGVADGAEFIGYVFFMTLCANSVLFFYFRRLNMTFTVIRSISHGGYGAVYEVSCSKDDGRYALKLEQRQFSRDHYKLMMEVQVIALICQKLFFQN